MLKRRSMKSCIALALGLLMAMSADAQMSIIGPATPAGDLTTDFDMVQNPGDSAVWTLSIYLSDGAVKFRKNHDLMLTWGDATFPTGTGIPGGPIFRQMRDSIWSALIPVRWFIPFHRDSSASTMRHRMLPLIYLVRLHSVQRILMSRAMLPRYRPMSA